MHIHAHSQISQVNDSSSFLYMGRCRVSYWKFSLDMHLDHLGRVSQAQNAFWAFHPQFLLLDPYRIWMTGNILFFTGGIRCGSLQPLSGQSDCKADWVGLPWVGHPELVASGFASILYKYGITVFSVSPQNGNLWGCSYNKTFVKLFDFPLDWKLNFWNCKIY